MNEFNHKVYEIVRRIPYGRVMTYGQIATLLGVPRAARAVGWALHWVDEKEEVPCQRVVNRFGGMATGYGWGGQQAHKADLEVENVEVRADFTIDLKKYQWWPEEGELPEYQLSPEARTELDQKLASGEERLSTKKVQPK
jgi:methylated-DNA-protein-cysteine methyltransferase-like protein